MSGATIRARLRRAVGLALLLAALLVWRPEPLGAADVWPEYPYEDPYVATALGTPKELAMPTFMKSPPQGVSVRLEGREVPEVFRHWETLACTETLQKGPAPLVFLIAGTGSAADSQRMLFLQRLLFDDGYHVVSLPSPTHPDFIVSASSSRAPGYLPDDAADLYRIMSRLKQDLEKRVEVTDWRVMGYSLGGAQAAYVAWIDERERRIGFSKALMVNPAVDLYDSALRLDGLLDEKTLKGEEPLRVLDGLLNKFSAFYLNQQKIDLGEDLASGLAGALNMTREELLVAIGSVFRLSSMNMAFVSDVCKRAGYIVPADRPLQPGESRERYFDAAMRVSFKDYFNEYLYPFLKHREPEMTKDEALRRLSLESIRDYLASSDKVEAITNADDIILTPDNVRFLRETMGARASIHPRGGHCGTLSYGPFAAEILQRLASRAPVQTATSLQ